VRRPAGVSIPPGWPTRGWTNPPRLWCELAAEEHQNITSAHLSTCLMSQSRPAEAQHERGSEGAQCLSLTHSRLTHTHSSVRGRRMGNQISESLSLSLVEIFAVHQLAVHQISPQRFSFQKSPHLAAAPAALGRSRTGEAKCRGGGRGAGRETPRTVGHGLGLGG
jgi:hypothetical protein